MKSKPVWYRGSGKTTRMIEAAKLLGRPVAVVANVQIKADEFARRIGSSSVGYGFRSIAKAYESGLPVFIDSTVFEDQSLGLYEAESVMPPANTTWRRLPEWK